MRKLILIAVLVAASTTVPALADPDASTVLTIENEAGMVTNVTGMTGRECDAAVALLSARKTPKSLYSDGITLGSNGTYVMSSISLSPTPNLRKATCVVPAAKP